MPDRALLKLQEEIETLKAELAAMKRGATIRLHGVLRRLLADPRARIALAVAVVAIPLAAYAGQIIIPYTFVNGTVADATEVNANFGALVTESNAQDSRLTTVEDDLGVHEGNPSAHHVKTTSFSDLGDSATDAQIPDDITINYANTAGSASTAGNADTLDTLDSTDFALSGHDHDDRYYSKAYVDALEARIAALEALLIGVSRGGTPDTLTFSAMNVQVNDGSGDTEGAVNGLGNLIVGYNENDVSATRTGSHNLVVGIEHEYTSYGGFVAGRFNTITGQYVSVSGGRANQALGDYSSVSAGNANNASGNLSSVSGGVSNEASGYYSSISGGNANTASGSASSAIGPIPSLTITGN
jgi:hypothetical protein